MHSLAKARQEKINLNDCDFSLFNIAYKKPLMLAAPDIRFPLNYLPLPLNLPYSLSKSFASFYLLLAACQQRFSFFDIYFFQSFNNPVLSIMIGI